jgi:hypothetical protein
VTRARVPLAGTPLATGRYQSWRPVDGVPIRSTVGEPKFWRHGPLIFVRELAADQPDTLHDLQRLWLIEAGKNQARLSENSVIVTKNKFRQAYTKCESSSRLATSTDLTAASSPAASTGSNSTATRRPTTSTTSSAQKERLRVAMARQ